MEHCTSQPTTEVSRTIKGNLYGLFLGLLFMERRSALNCTSYFLDTIKRVRRFLWDFEASKKNICGRSL